MAVKVVMPKLGLNAQEGLLVEWFKSEGDLVLKGEPLFSLETEKTTMESEAPADGVLSNILVDENETVPVGSVVAFIVEEGEILPDSDKADVLNTQNLPIKSIEKTNVTERNPSGQSKRVLASPLARKMAKIEGIDLGDVQNKYNLDIVQVSDIEKFQAEMKKNISGSEAARLSIRKQISTRVMRSLQETAQFTIHSEIDVTLLIEKREKLKKDDGQACGINAYFGVAVATALGKYPEFNTTINGDDIVESDEINLGLAVDTKDGLKIIVFHGIENQSLDELNQSINDLVPMAINGTIPVDKLSGSTFTITNLGSLGVGFFTPIINYPEVAILGLGKLQERLSIQSGKITQRWMMDISLTVDHRFIDGAPAAKFLNAIARNVNLL